MLPFYFETKIEESEDKDKLEEALLSKIWKPIFGYNDPYNIHIMVLAFIKKPEFLEMDNYERVEHIKKYKDVISTQVLNKIMENEDFKDHVNVDRETLKNSLHDIVLWESGNPDNNQIIYKFKLKR